MADDQTPQDDSGAELQASGEGSPQSVLRAALLKCCHPTRRLRLLEIGCGSGTFLASLEREMSSRWDYHGIDRSKGHIEAGRQRFPGLKLTTGDSTDVAAARGRFDVVVCLDAMAHLENPDTSVVELSRILAPGGWLLVALGGAPSSTPRADDPDWRVLFEQAGVLTLDPAVAARCGAEESGAFLFGVRSATEHPIISEAGAALLELGDLAHRLAATLEPDIVRAGELLVESLRSGGKILACGNGGSAADAQHFVAELVGRLNIEGRRGLAAMSLSSDPSVVTALANDFGYERVFSRQVEAHGRAGDVLIAISTSGCSPNLLVALGTARSLGLRTLVLLGDSVPAGFREDDVVLSVPSADAQRVQEAHTAVLHAIATFVEGELAEGAPSP